MQLKSASVRQLESHDHFGAARGRFFGSVPHAIGQMALSPFIAHLPAPNLSPPEKQETMAILSELLDTGKLTPSIDQVFSLAEVSLALRHLESGDAIGRIVVVP